MLAWWKLRTNWVNQACRGADSSAPPCVQNWFGKYWDKIINPTQPATHLSDDERKDISIYECWGCDSSSCHMKLSEWSILTLFRTKSISIKVNLLWIMETISVVSQFSVSLSAILYYESFNQNISFVPCGWEWLDFSLRSQSIEAKLVEKNTNYTLFNT